VANVQNALKVPNTALRYKPPLAPEDVFALYKRYGVEMNEKINAKEQASSTSDGIAQVSANMQNTTRAPKTDTAVVWKLGAGNAMEPVKVSLGITDHAYTEVTAVVNGELKEGDAVIIRSVVPKGTAPGTLKH
jgi:hypothetical protein